MDKCYEDPIAQRLMKRVENITGIPEANHEYFQLLKYDVNQHYQEHSDYIEVRNRTQVSNDTESLGVFSRGLSYVIKTANAAILSDVASTVC